MKDPLCLRIVIVFVCLDILLCTQPYIKITHNTDQSAKCLDGSPAALYEHLGEQKDKFLIFFGGGGSCGGDTLAQTLQNCYQRSKTYLGSSKYMLDEMRPQGIISTDPSKSKFANWTKFIFAYCDGSFHQGNRINPISYKDSQLYFRGSNITRAHFNYIQSKYNLRAAKQVVITGVSAGAMATYMWTNHVQSMFSDPNIVSTIIDSGVFINDKSIKTGQPKSAIMLQNVYRLANFNEQTPFEECNNFASKQNETNCFFFQYSHPFIKGRILNLLSFYDTYDLKYQYQIDCLSPGQEGQTFTNCSSQEQNAIDQRFEKTFSLSQSFTASSEKHSTWAISCANHVYLGNWKFYSSQNQRVGLMTVKEAVQNFVLENQRVLKIDGNKWPMNQNCAY